MSVQRLPDIWDIKLRGFNISKETAASIFKKEERGRRLHRNSGT